MGTELLVASLWGAVAVYWLWSKRPASGDTISLFHRELEVLQRTTPARVAPANRLAAPPALQPPVPPQVAVAVALHRRDEARRRRRDILAVLVGVMVVTLVAAVASGSAVALAFQAVADLALAGYMYLMYLLSSVRRPERARRPTRAYGDFASYSDLSLNRAR
jgi:hypothetical protein